MKQININKAILYSGIGIYLFGYIAILVSALVFNKQDNFQQPVLEIFTYFPPLIVFAFTTIYASIFEEIAFRGWIIKRKIWKHISLSLIVIFVYLGLNSIAVAILSAAILFVIFYKIKDARLKLILSVVSTSLLFGLIHYANYTDWGRLFAIIQLVGFSFILCYLGLRFGFIFCVLGHFFNNLIAMLVLTVFISNDYSGEFSNKSYTANISKNSFFDMSNGSYGYMGRKKINTTGTITQIAESLTEFDNNTVYNAQVSNLIKYKFKAVANEDYLIDRTELLADFIEYTGITADTTYKPAYILIVNDTTRLKNPSIEDKNTYINSIRNLTGSIRDIYKAPLILKDDQYNYDLLLYIELFNIGLILDEEKAFTDFKARLYQNYGIEIIRDSTKKARVITFKE